MEQKDVPYIAYEGALARNERSIKRLIIALIIAIIIAIILIFASNVVWLYAWMKYDYASESIETITVDGKSGNANYVVNGGMITNGKDYSSAD